MSVNAKLPLRVRFNNFCEETISSVNKKRSRFFNTIENALESLASNKKIESFSFEMVTDFTERINLIPPPVEDMSQAAAAKEDVAVEEEGVAVEEEGVVVEEEEEGGVVEVKEDAVVEKARGNLEHPKVKNALKVSLALATIAAVAFSYYYFSSIPNESSAAAAGYMNQSYGFAYAQEGVLEAVNTTVLEEPLTYSNSSYVRVGRVSSVSENAFYTIFEGCYRNVSGVISSAYPIIEPVGNATSNVTETIVKNSSEKVSQLQAGYTRATAEAGKQFFKATIGLFGQMLAKSVGR